MELFRDASAVVSRFFDGLPPIAGAFLVSLLGGFLAVVVKHLFPKILRLLRFDRLCEKTGIVGFLRKGNVAHSPSDLLGILAFWCIMVLVLSNAVARLDESMAKSLALWLGSALPKTLAAGIVLVIGVVFVTFLSNFFVTVARNAAVQNPILLGRVLKTVGVVVVATMALEILGLGRTILPTILLVLCAAVALAFALAFGLGCKDLARKALEEFLRNLQERERSRHGTDLEG